MENPKVIFIGSITILTILAAVMGFTLGKDFSTETEETASLDQRKSLDEIFSTDERKTLEEIFADVESTEDELPLYYGGSILHTGGIGSSQVEVNAPTLEGAGYYLPGENYVKTSFNSIRDILWINCRKNYKMATCESSTDNNIFFNDALGNCGLELENQLQNRAFITCNKTTQ